MFDRQRLKTDLVALALLAGTVFCVLSLASYHPADSPGDLVYPPRSEVGNAAGPWGARLAHGMFTLWGAAAFVWPVCLALYDTRLLVRAMYPDPYIRGFGWLLLVTVVSSGLSMMVPGWSSATVYGSGGYVGALSSDWLLSQFSPLGTFVLLSAALLAAMMLATDTLVLKLASGVVLGPYWLFHRVAFGHKADTAPEGDVSREKPLRIRVTDRETAAAAAATAAIDSAALELAAETTVATESTEATVAAIPVRAPEIRVNPPVTAMPRSLARPLSPPVEKSPYQLPDLDMLELAEEFPYAHLAEKARVAAATLEKTFLEFGLNVKVVEIDTGPVITQFELELEAGLRLSKVTNLADDLAIALRVPSVRVVAPIPGKNTVGVEVPNDKQVMVRLRELMETTGDSLDKKRIPIFLGKDVSGRPMVVDLAKMPHLLIAGRTGTGKSVCLNALILSLLMTRTPDQVRLLMIDPKMVELSPYMRIPHLMHPVITDMKKAEAMLAWAVDKMEERYDLLARCGVRHLDNYNALPREEKLRRLGLEPDTDEADQIPDHMPYIVIIADEMADMMMTSGKEVEGHIIRLAQKSRAVGIHLVLATQKPTVDVITGLIKSNLPARISFQVASRMDSRVVLDEMGADKLLGNGDMLYLAPGTSHISRAQGTYVSDDEVNSVIEFYNQYEPQYSRELATLSTRAAGKSGIEAIRARDEMYEQAIEVVVREGRGSVSLLQRCLGIGYGRAARLIDYMAEDGIVGDYNGSQARDVLYTPEQWQAIVDGESVDAALSA